jgi:hypothetical protein
MVTAAVEVQAPTDNGLLSGLCERTNTSSYHAAYYGIKLYYTRKTLHQFPALGRLHAY